jgi:hypothetical protein
MAKRRRRAQSTGGPYVATAVFCERVLQDKDGVASLIRIIDRVTFSFPEGQAAPPLSMWAAITIKAGFMRGKYALMIRGIAPSGRELPAMSVPVLFEGEDRGVGIYAQMNLAQLEEGLYWFDVIVEETLLTRIPLRILFQQISLQATPSQSV